MPKKKIYLDYAATTPVSKEVLKEMLPFFSEKFGNAMSVHSFGQEALEAVDLARERVANFFGAQIGEIIFASGATEANNLAIKGLIKSYYADPKNKIKPHIITTIFEHHCVLNACKAVEKENLAEITYLPIGKDGIINPTQLKKAIKKNTILISVMYVNNEIGTVQPIETIGKIIQKIRQSKTEGKTLYPLFHTDAAQAINYFDCDVKKLGVDLLSMSAHKIYGPKGVGVLYIKKGTPIKHIQDGGDQEFKMRAGTHNVPGIVGLGKAIELINSQLATLPTGRQARNSQRILKLRNYLIKKVLKEISKAYLNGSKIKRSPNNASFRFDNVEGEGLLLSLDIEGIAVSTGSACSSGALEPSHVLLALGLKHEQAHGSLRVTLGKETTKKEIDFFIKKLKEIIQRLRKISGGVLKDFNS
ncbi:MAG: cysteine desulfurase NifS [Candidatus Moranbacteria bacterium CG10_big_fil_rev_8_21_14_0_10_35_21]|nr:MAG: cysteine desulfurase NifS [Candidatus Moranbacteria bacterium CG10_big_fil_rev_8_21_14_0_10_35_21]PJA88593.1 MAG: cysteine desulfurase NifS [Candidatus Moranbacteria bacterium CG_4_9_14_3_um_filter_36_9]